MKQKVLMVHNYYQIGGGEHTVFHNETELLRSHGHEVVEYTRSNAELKTSKLKLLLSPLSTLWSVKTYREVRRLIRERQIDVVHCHNTFPLISPSVYAAARSLKVPVIQTIHNFRLVCPCGVFYTNGQICEKCLHNGLLEALKNKCYRSSFVQTLIVAAMLKLHRLLGTYRKIQYIFLTKFNRDKIGPALGLNDQQMFIKPNFAFEMDISRRVEDYSKGKYFFVGRLDAFKGIQFLVDTWKNNDFGTLYIYGSGEMEEYVKNAADGKRIIYRGFISKDAIYQECADAEAMLFASEWYEGFPMTIVESLSCGIPVISTGIGNGGSIIQDGVNGYKYQPGSAESFAHALQNVRKEGADLRLKTYHNYQTYFTAEANYQTLSEIYQKSGEKNAR